VKPAAARTPPAPTSICRAALALAALALVPYAATVAFGFVLDDLHLVVLNPRLATWRDGWQYLAEAHGWQYGYATYYRPLVYWSLMLNHGVSGTAAWSYHLFNMLAHGMVTLLVWVLARRWFAPWAAAPQRTTAAWLAAAVFAVHPLHTEAVANVAGRADVLMTLWVLLGLWCAWHGYRGSVAAAWCAGVCACLAGLTKETGFLFPVLLGVWDVTLARRAAGRRRMRRRVWLTTLLGTASAMTLYAAAQAGASSPYHVAFLDNCLAGAPWAVRAPTALMLLGRALQLLVVPWPLSADYSFAQIRPVPTFLTMPAACAAGVLGCGLLWAWQRPRTSTKRVAAFGMLWFLAAYLPSSNLLFLIGTIFGERLLYLASAGVCMTIGWLAVAVLRTRRRLLLVCGPVLALGLCWTVLRSSVWRAPETLQRALLRDAPRSAKTHYARARADLAAGNTTAALAAITTTLAICQPYPEAHALRAGVLLRMGDAVPAWHAAHTALALNPHVIEAHYYCGLIALQRGETNTAQRHLRHVLRLRTSNGAAF
jgi:hypothetical protein